MASDFFYGHDQAAGWRQLRGPGYLNLPATVATLGLLDIDPRLGFVGHQPGGFPDWRVFAKPPDRLEIFGLLFEDAEYSRLDFDPYRAVSEVLGLEFARGAVEAGLPRRAATATPVPVDDPGYLSVAYGLFRAGELTARRRTYWSVLPSTGGASWSPLTWFVSRSEGAVPVADLARFFPLIRDRPAEPARPVPAPESDRLAALTAALGSLEDALRNAVSELACRVDLLVSRVEELERRSFPPVSAGPTVDANRPDAEAPTTEDSMGHQDRYYLKNL